MYVGVYSVVQVYAYTPGAEDSGIGLGVGQQQLGRGLLRGARLDQQVLGVHRRRALVQRTGEEPVRLGAAYHATHPASGQVEYFDANDRAIHLQTCDQQHQR